MTNLKHMRYVLTENPLTLASVSLFVLFVFVAAFGPLVIPFNPLASDTQAALQPPSVVHWFGTDQLGRDIFSRVVVATRLDFFIALVAVLLSFVVGSIFGSLIDRPQNENSLTK